MGRIAWILAYSASLVVLGMAGAWAFHPDGGGILRSYPLWEAFGLAAYFGFAAFVLTALATPFVLVIGACRRRHRAQA